MIPRAVVVLLAGISISAPAVAQDPARIPLPKFELPFGSPRMYAMGVRAINVKTADSKLGDGWQAEALLGENFPIIALQRGRHPISLGLGLSVTGRVGAGDHQTFVGSDWTGELNVNADLGHWNLAGSLWHESSHLGDEYQQDFGVDDAHWSRDGLSAWVFYRTGPWTLGANLNWVTKDVAGRDPWGASASVDFRGAPTFLGIGLTPRAGVYLEGNGYADWDPMLSGKLGVGFPVAGGPECTISIMGLTGPSPQRQFFDQHTDYLALEFRFDL